MSDEFLGGGGTSLPAVKFTTVGDKVVGNVTNIKKLEDRDPNGTLKTWPNGDPKYVFVFNLGTEGGEVALWVRGNMVKAIKEAAAASGVTGTLLGCQLAVQYTGDGEPSVKGYHAPKLFRAQVKPAAASISVDDLL